MDPAARGLSTPIIRLLNRAHCLGTKSLEWETEGSRYHKPLKARKHGICLLYRIIDDTGAGGVHEYRTRREYNFTPNITFRCVDWDHREPSSDFLNQGRDAVSRRRYGKPAVAGSISEVNGIPSYRSRYRYS